MRAFSTITYRMSKRVRTSNIPSRSFADQSQISFKVEGVVQGVNFRYNVLQMGNLALADEMVDHGLSKRRMA